MGRLVNCLFGVCSVFMVVFFFKLVLCGVNIDVMKYYDIRYVNSCWFMIMYFVLDYCFNCKMFDFNDFKEWLMIFFIFFEFVGVLGFLYICKMFVYLWYW